jgi:hypothetical protein
MNEFFNWNDTWIVIQHNWFWLLVAFAAGCFFAHATRDKSSSQNN